MDYIEQGIQKVFMVVVWENLSFTVLMAVLDTHQECD